MDISLQGADVRRCRKYKKIHDIVYGQHIKFCRENIIDYLRGILGKKMIERHFILDGIDLIGFYGAGNVHLQMLKKLQRAAQS